MVDRNKFDVEIDNNNASVLSDEASVLRENQERARGGYDDLISFRRGIKEVLDDGRTSEAPTTETTKTTRANLNNIVAGGKKLSEAWKEKQKLDNVNFLLRELEGEKKDAENTCALLKESKGILRGTMNHLGAWWRVRKIKKLEKKLQKVREKQQIKFDKYEKKAERTSIKYEKRLEKAEKIAEGRVDNSINLIEKSFGKNISKDRAELIKLFTGQLEPTEKVKLFGQNFSTWAAFVSHLGAMASTRRQRNTVASIRRFDSARVNASAVVRRNKGRVEELEEFQGKKITERIVEKTTSRAMLDQIFKNTEFLSGKTVNIKMDINRDEYRDSDYTIDRRATSGGDEKLVLKNNLHADYNLTINSDGRVLMRNSTPLDAKASATILKKIQQMTDKPSVEAHTDKAKAGADKVKISADKIKENSKKSRGMLHKASSATTLEQAENILKEAQDILQESNTLNAEITTEVCAIEKYRDLTEAGRVERDYAENSLTDATTRQGEASTRFNEVVINSENAQAVAYLEIGKNILSQMLDKRKEMQDLTMSLSVGSIPSAENILQNVARINESAEADQKRLKKIETDVAAFHVVIPAPVTAGISNNVTEGDIYLVHIKAQGLMGETLAQTQVFQEIKKENEEKLKNIEDLKNSYNPTMDNITQLTEIHAQAEVIAKEAEDRFRTVNAINVKNTAAYTTLGAATTPEKTAMNAEATAVQESSRQAREQVSLINCMLSLQEATSAGEAIAEIESRLANNISVIERETQGRVTALGAVAAAKQIDKEKKWGRTEVQKLRKEADDEMLKIKNISAEFARILASMATSSPAATEMASLTGSLSAIDTAASASITTITSSIATSSAAITVMTP